MYKGTKKFGNLTIRLPEKQLVHLRKLSHQMSLRENKSISLNQIAKEALDKVHPMPGAQMNFNFEEEEDKDDSK